MAASTPLRFDPSLEKPAADEDETTHQLIQTMGTIAGTTLKDYGHALRSVHAKSHGLLKGELRVNDVLPEALAQGLFAKGGAYPVIMRFSTNPGDILDDSVSAPRGLAIKVFGVEGERLPESEGDRTQDFVLANAPAFQVPDPKSFLGALKILAKTTDTAQGAKKVASAVMRGAETVIETLGGESALVKNLGGQRLTQILGDSFYSQAPMLHGPYIAKLAVVPVSPALAALAGQPLELNGDPNALRTSMVDFFARQGGAWEVRIQLCTDLDKMPIEDASVTWPEDVSPYVAVARIEVPAQEAWSDARSKAIDDGLAFSPWHGLAAHRPIGGIMRSRRHAYHASASFRGSHTGCPMHEPASADEVAA